jgi:hypothetical protein
MRQEKITMSYLAHCGLKDNSMEYIIMHAQDYWKIGFGGKSAKHLFPPLSLPPPPQTLPFEYILYCQHNKGSRDMERF